MAEADIPIPNTFSLREQLEELRMVYKAKSEFVHGRINSGKPVAPSKDLALYSLARLKAAGQTLACLVEGRPIDSVPGKVDDSGPPQPKTLPPAEKAQQEQAALVEESRRPAPEDDGWD